MSVAWVSPLRKRVGGKKELVVFPTREVTAWLAEHPGTTTGQLLRHLGLRDRKKEPRRPWKVTVFEVDTAELCGGEPGWTASWRRLARRGFCVLPADRFLAEATSEP